jgi:DNA-binding transcriptional regulator YdaS (Cro superfamily)
MSTPISRAIEKAGGQKPLADILNVHPAMVSQWATGRRPVAAHHVLAIEEATGVSRHDLRPDVFGSAPAETEKAA